MKETLQALEVSSINIQSVQLKFFHHISVQFYKTKNTIKQHKRCAKSMLTKEIPCDCGCEKEKPLQSQ